MIASVVLDVVGFVTPWATMFTAEDTPTLTGTVRTAHGDVHELGLMLRLETVESFTVKVVVLERTVVLGNSRVIVPDPSVSAPEALVVKPMPYVAETPVPFGLGLPFAA